MTLSELREVVRIVVKLRRERGYSYSPDVEAKAVAAGLWCTHDKIVLADAIAAAVDACAVDLRFPWLGSRTLQSVQVHHG